MLFSSLTLIIVVIDVTQMASFQDQTEPLQETVFQNNNVENTTIAPYESGEITTESQQGHSKTTTTKIYESNLLNAFVNDSVDFFESYLKSLAKKKPPSKLNLNLQKKLRFLNQTSTFKLNKKNFRVDNFTHKFASNKTRKSYRMSINDLQNYHQSEKWIWITFELEGNCPVLHKKVPMVTSQKITSEMSNYLRINQSLISLNDIYCSQKKVSLNISVFQTTFIENEFDWMQQFRHTDATIFLLAQKYTVSNYRTKKSAIFVVKYHKKRRYNNYYVLLSYSYSLLAVVVLIIASLLYCGRSFLNSSKKKSRFDTDLFMAYDEEKTEKPLTGTNENEVQNYYGNTMEVSEENEELLFVPDDKEEASKLLKSETTASVDISAANFDQRQIATTSQLTTFQSSGPRPVYHDYDEVSPESENFDDTDEGSDFSDSDDPDQCEELDTSNLNENLWYIGNPLYTVRSTPDLGTSEISNSKTTIQGSTESLGLTRVQYAHGSTSFTYETDF